MKLHIATRANLTVYHSPISPSPLLCASPAFVVAGAFLTNRRKQDNLGNKGKRKRKILHSAV